MACMHAHTRTHTHKQTNTHTYTHTHARTHTHTHARTHTYTHTHTHTNTHAHTQAHTHARTHTYTHTHTHTHMYKRAQSTHKLPVHSAKGFANFSASLAMLPPTCPCQKGGMGVKMRILVRISPILLFPDRFRVKTIPIKAKKRGLKFCP